MPRRKRLNTLYARSTDAADAKRTWDTVEPKLCLRVHGKARAYYVVYRFGKRPRWLRLGGLELTDKDARRLAKKVLVRVAEGHDPGAEKRAERGTGTFAEIYARYLEQHAKKRNRSWAQADGWVRRYLLPRWAKLPIKSIARRDVRSVIDGIGAPIAANQTLAAASAIFSWALERELIESNPAQKVKRNPTQSRERILSDDELRVIWPALSVPLRVVLLTGQRPGSEVGHMRWEHLKSGWWEMPGKPDPSIGWPGTKNDMSHRIWLSQPVLAILNEVNRGELSGFVFGKPITELHGSMRSICKSLKLERCTPHDLRRTFLSTVTRLGLGRHLMDVIANHRTKTKTTTDVYDRYSYSTEIQHVMEAVAAKLLALAEGKAGASNVVSITKGV